MTSVAAGNGRGGRGRTASSESTGSPAPQPARDCPLFMECEDEELSEAQVAHYGRKQQEFMGVMRKLEDLAKQGAKVTANADNSVTFRVTETTSTLGPVTAQPAGPGNQQYRFLMDPKTGRIIGSIPSQPGGAPPVLPSPPGMVRAPTATPPPRAQGGRGRGSSRGRQPVRPALTPSPAIQPAARGRTPPSRETTPSKPGSSQPALVDLTKPGVEPVGAQPIRKAFPALSVSAKPQRTVPNASAKRSELDAKVKGLLVHTPAKFTEWLIQQGLVRSEQFEVGPQGKVKLKLGMYSDGKKFPHSGGYVWIQEGAANKYTSVYKGSIFEEATHPPTVILKLMYHWSCQTNIPNVAQWVKVDNPGIDSFFALLRGVCVGAVQEEVINLGGSGKAVEIGVISLGTTTADGQKREVRVEVLGVLDRQTRNLRLRATEPIQGANQAERFGKIFEPLPVWVNKSSRIMTDFSVDRETLVKLGYKNVSQCSLSQAQSQRAENTNQQIMEYLKKVVPKMFQNTLSNLTTPVIQQFLDELTFRELFGQYPLACFDNVVQRISSQTANTANSDDTMSGRLARVSANPFQDWRFSTPRSSPAPSPIKSDGGRGVEAIQRPASSSGVHTKRASSGGSEADLDALVTKRIKMAKELVPLESYYYCSLLGEDEVLAGEFEADMAFKCHVCKKLFMNNLEFMKHLHLHVETDREAAIDMADLTQCKYCYRDFDSEVKAQEHMDGVHYKKGHEFVCRICDEGFGGKNMFIHHMMRMHVKAEMPYLCQICFFRSSQHRDMVEHFQVTHDRTDKLQCPHCLKTFSLYGDKGYNTTIAVSFTQHLQKHEDIRSKSNLNCKKCALKFIDDKSLKFHAEHDHVSYKDWEDVELYQYLPSDKPVEMPRPDERLVKTAIKKSSVIKPLPQQAAFAAQNLEDMVIYDVIGDRCCECDKGMTIGGHYVAYLCCTKCRYSSCCAKAMSVHVQLFHGGTKPEYNLGKTVILPEPMFCVCGFSTTSGNKLAKHLGTNGCKSAYPSLVEANKAKVDTDGEEGGASGAMEVELEKGLDPRMSITEVHLSEKKEKQKDENAEEKEEPGPLAFLGLQRKESRGDDEEESDENKIEKATDEKDEDESKEKDDKNESEEKDDKNESKEKEDKNESKEKDDKSDSKEKDDKHESEDKDEDGMDTDKDVEDKSPDDDCEQSQDDDNMETEEEEAGVKPGGGMLLFGTLFNYMGDKKDETEEGEGKDETEESNQNKDVAKDANEEGVAKGDTEEGKEGDATEGKEGDATEGKVGDAKEGLKEVEENEDNVVKNNTGSEGDVDMKNTDSADCPVEEDNSPSDDKPLQPEGSVTSPNKTGGETTSPSVTGEENTVSADSDKSEVSEAMET